MPASIANVTLWGKRVGAVAWADDRRLASFEYDPTFLARRLNVAPLTMPLARTIYTFPELSFRTFHGLPGLLADALPDSYGTKLIDVWLRRQGRSADSFNSVERLCYMGSRGMGALEFHPAMVRGQKSSPLEVSQLVELARQVVADKEQLLVNLSGNEAKALDAVIRVGTSAAGARAKAVIAWNSETNEIRSGQVKAPEGFRYWLLKFDGVSGSALGDPEGFGMIEYAYHLMARAAGIEMTECRLLKEGGRAHFMTRRFDRTEKGEKIHAQSFCALAHRDFNAPGSCGYEDALAVCQELGLGQPALAQLFRRMVFNVIARNQDDHTRNVVFLMDPAGTWTLSPAFDVIWSYNPKGEWTNRHQMTVNGKQSGFTADDLLAVAARFGIKKSSDIVAQVGSSVCQWRGFAEQAGVKPDMADAIGATHRLKLAG
jgi:serine/threonine-protein kinase HipA